MQLTVAANRAPISQADDGTWETSVGGLTTALLPVLQEHGGVWVAMGEDPDLPERQPYPEDDPDFLVRRVPLSEEELDNYYYGMANRVLWPVSHYLIQHLDLKTAFIDDYRRVNERFAEAVLEETEEDATIWVQDYHLMLAPGFIRDARAEATIGMFWHIPWPAMEVFRILPWARELMRGMLGCDVIGFHVDEYVENFIEGARVLLDAEVDEERGLVHWQGRTVRVEAHPIGIEVDRFESTAAADHIAEEAEAVRDEFDVEHLIIGIDRLDYTKGILSRLLAFEQFLEDNPDYHGRVSFFQVATPSRTEVASYQQLKREVDEAVGRINGAFAQDHWVPVHYRYRRYTQEELCAFYRAADAALITPLRDGMNVVTQEFVTATERGVLILSELTGAAYLMPAAVQVNPYDQNGVAAAIKEALEMSDDERTERLRHLKETVRTKLDVHDWADHFLEVLEEGKG